MNPNETSDPNSDTWARPLVEQLKGRFPHLANAVSSGLTSDPFALLATLPEDKDLATDFHDFWTMLEPYRRLHRETASAEKKDLLVQNQELKVGLQETADKIHVIGKFLERLHQNRSSEIHSGTARQIFKHREIFSGEEKDAAKRQQEFVAWRSQIEGCFARDPAAFDDERRKILHIAGFLDGEAFDLNQHYFDNIALNPLAKDSWHWKTAGELFQSLSDQFAIQSVSAQFATIDLAQQDSLTVDHLSMLHKTFQDLVAEFRTVDQCCGEAEAQKVEALKKKAPEELAGKEADQPLPPAKENFNAWCKLCRNLITGAQAN